MPGYSLTPVTYTSRAILSADDHVTAVGAQRLLCTRDFGLVWLSQLVSQVGDGVSKLALLWFVYSITGSPIKTTVIGLLQTIPPIVLGPASASSWIAGPRKSCWFPRISRARC